MHTHVGRNTLSIALPQADAPDAQPSSLVHVFHLPVCGGTGSLRLKSITGPVKLWILWSLNFTKNKEHRHVLSRFQTTHTARLCLANVVVLYRAAWVRQEGDYTAIEGARTRAKGELWKAISTHSSTHMQGADNPPTYQP